jgi:hypothetical protein
MGFYKKIIMVTSIFVIPFAINADNKIDQAISKIYSRFDKANDCWITKASTDNFTSYCMKVDQYNKIRADTGEERTYVLLAGMEISDDGNLGGGHASPGLVSALIFEGDPEKLNLIASNLEISIGQNGYAPTGWKLIKLAPSNYWGWQVSAEYGETSGSSITYGVILAPYSKTIKQIAHIPIQINTGDDSVEYKLDLESSLYINISSISDGLYQLIAKTSGKINGKKIVKKTWKIPFDKKTWTYEKPKNWVIPSEL